MMRIDYTPVEENHLFYLTCGADTAGRTYDPANAGWWRDEADATAKHEPYSVNLINDLYEMADACECGMQVGETL